MKLYEINAAIESVLNKVDPDTGEMPDDAATELADLEMAFSEKAEQIAFAIRNAEAEAAACHAEAMRFADRAQAANRRAAGLKGYLMYEMQRRGADKVAGTLLNLSVQANASPRLVVADEAAVPRGYWSRATPVLNKALIASEMKAGVAVPGCKLEYGNHLRIR